MSVVTIVPTRILGKTWPAWVVNGTCLVWQIAEHEADEGRRWFACNVRDGDELRLAETTERSEAFRLAEEWSRESNHE